MGKLGFLVLALVLMAPSPAIAQTTDDQFLIIPGERIGRVKLGMMLDEVKSILGTPRSSKKLPSDPYTSSEPYTVYEWPSQDGTHNGRLEVFVDENNKVTKIGIYLDTRYATSEGLRAGSSMVEIMRNFAEVRPITVQGAMSLSLVYDNQGITFIIKKPLGANGVEEILVAYQGGQAPPTAKKPTCSLKDPTKDGCLVLFWINVQDRHGATLVVDGHDACRAPELVGLPPGVDGTLCSVSLPAGSHHYGIRKDGGQWCHQDEEVNVEAGRDTTVSCLWRGPGSSHLVDPVHESGSKYFSILCFRVRSLQDGSVGVISGVTRRQGSRQNALVFRPKLLTRQ